MLLVQQLRQSLRIGQRVPRAHEAARNLRRSAAQRLVVERVATEEIDLFELREQARAGVAARDALQLVDRQVFTRVDAIRIELRAVVEVTRDQQDVAAHAL